MTTSEEERWSVVQRGASLGEQLVALQIRSKRYSLLWHGVQ